MMYFYALLLALFALINSAPVPMENDSESSYIDTSSLPRKLGPKSKAVWIPEDMSTAATALNEPKESHVLYEKLSSHVNQGTGKQNPETDKKPKGKRIVGTHEKDRVGIWLNSLDESVVVEDQGYGSENIKEPMRKHSPDSVADLQALEESGIWF